MTAKIDRKSAMRATLSAEKRDVNARFAAADAVLAERPSGFAVAAPLTAPGSPTATTFSAESDPVKKRNIVTVPLNLVYDNPVNARHVYRPDAIKALAAVSQRCLIETLAEEIATMLLAAYPLAAVEIELRKYILPDTEFVAVRIRRS